VQQTQRRYNLREQNVLVSLSVSVSVSVSEKTPRVARMNTDEKEEELIREDP
jgi:hypothetical protein